MKPLSTDKNQQPLFTEPTYDRLRDLARMLMRRQVGGSLTATELLHEAFIKLANQHAAPPMQLSDDHAMASIVKTMQHVLIDRSRYHKTQRRDSSRTTQVLDWNFVPDDKPLALLEALSESLDEFRQVDDRSTNVVELRFFVGLTMTEIADVLGITERTVRRDWTFARAWLQRELSEVEA